MPTMENIKNEEPIRGTNVHRSVGQSLFLGPSDMGTVVRDSLTSRWRRTLTIGCGLREGVGIATKKHIIGSLPENLVDDGEQIFADVYASSPNFVIDDARRLFGLLDVAEMHDPGVLTRGSNHLEFNRTYFLLAGGFKAMITAVLGEDPCSVDFKIFSKGNYPVLTHDKLFRELMDVRRDPRRSEAEVARAGMAVSKLRDLHFKHIVSVLNTLHKCDVNTLL